LFESLKSGLSQLDAVKALINRGHGRAVMAAAGPFTWLDQRKCHGESDAPLFIRRTQHLARFRFNEVHLLAGKACNRLIVFGVVRSVFCYKALDSIAGVRAAVKKKSHLIRSHSKNWSIGFWSI